MVEPAVRAIVTVDMPTRRLTKRIGSDHVILRDDHLVVLSHAHMEAWRVRSYRQTVIRFEGRSWRVIEVRAVPPNATQYTLALWDLSDHDVVGQTVEYGLAFVEERDRAAVQAMQTRRVSGLLRLVAPLTGFLGARIKDRLESSFGIDPLASTKQSVMMESIAIMGGFVLMRIGMVTGVIPYLPFLFMALVLLPDAVVRWDRILGEQRPPPGFYEWIFGK